MEPMLAIHTHSITAASDFKMLLIVFGLLGTVMTALLALITTLCGVIYRNTKDKCKTCNERILGDINSVAENGRADVFALEKSCIACMADRVKREDAIWLHIEESIWAAIEQCCPRLSTEMAKMWKKSSEAGTEE